MECNDFTDKKLSNIDFVGRRDLLIFTPWLGQLISKEGRKRRGYMQGKKTLINVVGVPRHDSREGMGKVFVYTSYSDSLGQTTNFQTTDLCQGQINWLTDHLIECSLTCLKLVSFSRSLEISCSFSSCVANQNGIA